MTPPSEGRPVILFCFDEARGLLSPSDLAFNSLRRALRHRSRPKEGCLKTDKEESFFAVLLDTYAKFNTFCPPRGLDPNAKFASKYEEQFHPLWKVNSFDVLAKGKHTIEMLTVNIDVEHLFSLGRPNWSARFHLGGIDRLVRDAIEKVYGGGTSKSLNEHVLIALLSYRMQFYVLSHVLAEYLVSGYMRMIYEISDDHRSMRTIQPSEPILAWVAFREIERKPGCKLQVLQNFHEQCARGSIDAGDIGEMVAALILMFSFDGKQYDNRPSPQGVFTFLESLSGQYIARSDNLQSRMNDDPDMKRLMSKGFVFFNHFARLEGGGDRFCHPAGVGTRSCLFLVRRKRVI